MNDSGPVNAVITASTRLPPEADPLELLVEGEDDAAADELACGALLLLPQPARSRTAAKAATTPGNLTRDATDMRPFQVVDTPTLLDSSERP
jgi:hypothetical protein